MKPFDLEKALAGEPVVTKNGLIGKVETSFTVKAGKRLVVTFQDGEDYDIYHHNGTHIHNLGGSELFMAEKPKVKKEGWVNVYRSGISENGYITAYKVFESQSDANNNITSSYSYVGSFKIEWEEEA